MVDKKTGRWDQNSPISQKASDRIAELVASAPPLGPEQTARLRAILQSAQGHENEPPQDS